MRIKHTANYKHLRPDKITRKTKCLIYKTLIRLDLVHGAETRTLPKSEEKLLVTFKRKIARHIVTGLLWQIKRNINFTFTILYSHFLLVPLEAY